MTGVVSFSDLERKCPVYFHILSFLIMDAENLPISTISVWAKLNNVIFNGVRVSPTSDGKGLGLFACTHASNMSESLITVPKDLVLCLENVWVFAKSDRYLREVLESVGEYSRVPFPVYTHK